MWAAAAASRPRGAPDDPSWLGGRYRRIVLQSGRSLDDHRLSGAHAGQHLAGIADRATERHRATLRPALLQYEDDFLVAFLAYRGSRHQHPPRSLLNLCGRLVFLEERHAHTHVRHDATVLEVEPNAPLHGRLGTIGGRDDCDDVRGNLPVGISVQHRFHRLPRLHAIDVGLVDVDLDLERIHVDDRADTGAREAAARGERRDDFPDLGGLGDHHARERCAHRAIAELYLRRAHTGRGELDLLALPLHLGGTGLDLSARLLHRLL